MPLTTKKIDDKWRVVELNGRIATKQSIPVDGGGHEDKSSAQSQAAAANMKGRKKRNMLA